jgi:hypothetical protein
MQSNFLYFDLNLIKPRIWCRVKVLMTIIRVVVTRGVIATIQHFRNLNQQGLTLLKQAYIVRIPKKDCSLNVSDYRPINLVHSFAKIIAKILANRLAHSSSIWCLKTKLLL